RHPVPSRAFQDRALEGWHGRDENGHTGQQALSHQARCNSAASLRNIHRRHGDDRVRAWDQRPIAGAPPPPYARGVTPLRSVTAIVLGAALLALVVAAPQAQELLRISGSVQWIAGSRMQVMTTSESPIAVDLTQADQSSYQMLRGGDSVIVDGVLSSDGRRFIASGVWPDARRGWAQAA